MKRNKLFEKLKNINIKDDIHMLRECDVLFFCHDVDRPILKNGKAYSPLIDSLREKFEAAGLRCISIAFPFSSLVGQKAYGGVIAVNKSYVIYSLIKLLKSYFGKQERKNFYNTILRKTGAKLIITIGAPSALSKAAHEAGILNAEILHGIGFVEPQWGWEQRQAGELPKLILSLDKISSLGFSPLSTKGVTITTIPHPFLSRFLPSRTHLLPAEWRFSDLPLAKFRKTILVSLQWAYAGDHGHHTQFENILENGLFFPEIEVMVETHSDIFWLFRLHPLHLRLPRYGRLVNFLKTFVSERVNCEWHQASLAPYPSVVMHCSGNIGMSSQSCYDAAAMGVPSLMLCPTVQPGGIHGDWFLDLVDEGYVKKLSPTLTGIDEWLDIVKPKVPRLSNLKDEAAWKSAFSLMLKESGLEKRATPAND